MPHITYRTIINQIKNIYGRYWTATRCMMTSSSGNIFVADQWILHSDIFHIGWVLTHNYSHIVFVISHTLVVISMLAVLCSCDKMNKLLHILRIYFSLKCPQCQHHLQPILVFQTSLIHMAATVLLTRRYSDKWPSQKINDPLSCEMER